MIEDYVPRSVLGLRTEANTGVIFPWFEKSLGVVGDVCEFGCFRGTLSIKLAFYLRCFGGVCWQKRVYCFDTFEGFTEGLAGGGFPRKGDYSDNDGAAEELGKWAGVLPLYPVRGDVRKMCMILPMALSFVWFDLDVGDVMEEVRRKVWHLITGETIIGVDDYGREECGTVRAWADEISGGNLWERVGHDDGAHVGFFRKIG